MKNNYELSLMIFSVISVIVLLIMETTGYISIGLLWVFSPIWLPISIILGVFIIALIYITLKILIFDRD